MGRPRQRQRAHPRRGLALPVRHRRQLGRRQCRWRAHQRLERRPRHPGCRADRGAQGPPGHPLWPQQHCWRHRCALRTAGAQPLRRTRAGRTGQRSSSSGRRRAERPAGRHPGRPHCPALQRTGPLVREQRHRPTPVPPGRPERPRQPALAAAGRHPGSAARLAQHGQKVPERHAGAPLHQPTHPGSRHRQQHCRQRARHQPVRPGNPARPALGTAHLGHGSRKHQPRRDQPHRPAHHACLDGARHRVSPEQGLPQQGLERGPAPVQPERQRRVLGGRPEPLPQRLDQLQRLRRQLLHPRPDRALQCPLRRSHLAPEGHTAQTHHRPAPHPHPQDLQRPLHPGRRHDQQQRRPPEPEPHHRPHGPGLGAGPADQPVHHPVPRQEGQWLQRQRHQWSGQRPLRRRHRRQPGTGRQA